MVKISLASRLFQRLNQLYSVRDGVVLGDRVHIGIGSIVGATRRLIIESDVYIGKFCTIQVNGAIGRGTLIANHVGVVGRVDHDFRRIGCLIRHAPWIGDRGGVQDERSEVRIGEDVWIGYGAIVLSGLAIGRGSIVAAGTVVVSDVAPYSIVAGNPGRVVGYRFSGEQQSEHERLLAARYGLPLNR